MSQNDGRVEQQGKESELSLRFDLPLTAQKILGKQLSTSYYDPTQ